jgi:hypothetical protein
MPESTSWDLIIPLPVGLNGDSEPIIEDSRGSGPRGVLIERPCMSGHLTEWIDHAVREEAAHHSRRDRT